MRSCNNCHAAVPDDSESCPQCGTAVSRGFLTSLFGMFRSKPAPVVPSAPVAPNAPASSPRPRGGTGFSMEVEDVFTIQGRGTVVIGEIASGELHIGDEVRFVSKKGAPMKSNVTGIEMFQKIVQVAKAGDKVGVLLRNVKISDIATGATIESV